MNKLVALMLCLCCLSVWTATTLAAEVGQAAPAFSAIKLDVRQQATDPAISLEHYRGKVVLIDFWASWCPPCRRSLPAFESLRERLGAQHFEVLAINVDEEPEEGRAFLSQLQISYPVLKDSQGELARLFAVEAMPVSYVVDKKGLIRYIHKGFNKGYMPKVEAVIKQLLEEQT